MSPQFSDRQIDRFDLVILLGLMLPCASSLGCGLPSGLLRSRWAMTDSEYAEKYAQGADKSDVAGKVKQACDARFVEGATGVYVSGGLVLRPDAESELGAIDVGAETYLTSFMTGRGSLSLMTDGDDVFTGVDAGLRLQSPTRLAPFVGVGAFAGFAQEVVPATDDGIDNDDDGFIDERGEDRERFSGALAALYPEVGTHFWWTPNLRLSGYGRYMVTSEGRAEDDWLIGGQLAIMSK